MTAEPLNATSTHPAELAASRLQSTDDANASESISTKLLRAASDGPFRCEATAGRDGLRSGGTAGSRTFSTWW